MACVHGNCQPVAAFQVARMVNNMPAHAGDLRGAGSMPGSGRSWLEEDMATHCGALAWSTPRSKKPGGLQPIGSQRVGHDWSVLSTHVSPQTNNPQTQTNLWFSLLPESLCFIHDGSASEVPWTSSRSDTQGGRMRFNLGGHTARCLLSLSLLTPQRQLGFTPKRGLRHEEESLIIQRGQRAVGRGQSEVEGVYPQKN